MSPFARGLDAPDPQPPGGPMNPLEQNPKARKVVYTVFWVLSLVLLGLQVGFGAAEVHQPTWLAVALAVFTAVSAAVGYTAYANTSAPADPPAGQ